MMLRIVLGNKTKTPMTAPAIVRSMFEDEDDVRDSDGDSDAEDGDVLIDVDALVVNVTPVVDVRPCAFNSVTSEVESVAASESSCAPTEDANASFKTSTTNSTSTPTTVCMRRRRPEVSSTFVTLMTRTLVGLVEMRLAIAATKATVSVSVKVSSV